MELIKNWDKEHYPSWNIEGLTTNELLALMTALRKSPHRTILSDEVTEELINQFEQIK